MNTESRLMCDNPKVARCVKVAECYYYGVAYATGSIINDDEKAFLCVRNLDAWYPKCIENISKHKAYQSHYNVARDGKPQWVIKARDIQVLPQLSEIASPADFIRAYIEIHSVLDLSSRKSRSGERYKAPRLRIYGNEEILEYIQKNVPAGKKAVQTITNRVGAKYKGETRAVYYQLKSEIIDILKWIDGNPRNEKVWDKWKTIID